MRRCNLVYWQSTSFVVRLLIGTIHLAHQMEFYSISSRANVQFFPFCFNAILLSSTNLHSIFSPICGISVLMEAYPGPDLRIVAAKVANESREKSQKVEEGRRRLRNKEKGCHVNRSFMYSH
jgi:hypothetical protein